MSGWCARFTRRKDGVSAVELAVALPIMLLIMTGITEFGRALYQTTLIERGLRSAGIYGARSDLPISAETITRMERLVKTGSIEPGQPRLLANWADAGSSVNITIHNYVVEGRDVPVLRIDAAVPFDPLMPGLFELFGFSGFTIQATHEQGYVGQ